MSLHFLKSIRAKLISIFVLIKVIPLIALAVFAWHAAVQLSDEVTDRSGRMADGMLETVKTVGETVIDDSTQALDDRSREAIERLTTDTAREVARFLYARDQDIMLAASLPRTETAFRNFLSNRTRSIYQHGQWQLNNDQTAWVPVTPLPDPQLPMAAELEANAKQFNYRQPEQSGQQIQSPLFREITLIGLDGKEQFRFSHNSALPLRDITRRENTYARAEQYWTELQRLSAGEIYVSEVIGTYIGSTVIGPYTPTRLKKMERPYEPRESAYAGTENPLGKRFQGIIRWATPVVEDGRITGYITLALDHEHIRQFTDRISPTDRRYTDIADAIEGNYAFMWDYKNRSISHPRDYFIHGYNAETGLPETPWMDRTLYQAWQASGLPSHEFLAQTPEFDQPSLDKKPSLDLIRQGTIALDCRYLNFSPQCQGWDQLTRHGGSGSFVIYFSGLWKLTTAATIPYYTGRYGDSLKGFGFVTIGANVDEFHQAAVESGKQIAGIVSSQVNNYQQQRNELDSEISRQLQLSTYELVASTIILILAVIAIAIWMADALTRRITSINKGLHLFHQGNYSHRLEVTSQDEMGRLASSFNAMADNIARSITRMKHEISIRRQKEEQLRIAAVAFETQEGMCITDASNTILNVNHAFTLITGYTADEAIGKTPAILRSGKHTDTFYQEIRTQVKTTGQWQGEIWSRRKNGEVFPEWLTITEVTNDRGEVTHYVRALTDISERKASEEHIRELAYYDPLTHLPNRRMLSEQLEIALKSAIRHNSDGALLFIDLDNFKTLNDSLGHHYGDMLLQQVASRLMTLVRQTDTVARFGGDEFVVMLTDLDADRERAVYQVQNITRKILDNLNRPYSFVGFEHHSTLSVGITLFSDHHNSGIDQVLQRADLAMYQAKANGRNAICFFDQQMQAAANNRAELEADLHEAIRQHQFELYYQPQVSCSGALLGAEALIRWNHPDKGLISPLDFIPVAEETGQIQAIGLWVIEQACAQQKLWRDQVGPEFTIAVNVSSRQYQYPNFVEDVVRILRSSNANPEQLTFELTESVLSEDVENIIDKMWQLRELGIGFALDDFGTGYSSLSYLKKLPLNYLKIDKSFVRDLHTDPNDAAIARTIVDLSHSMNISVIAEGVETEAQLNQLTGYGCTIFQGYLFSKPLPAEQVSLKPLTETVDES